MSGRKKNSRKRIYCRLGVDRDLLDEMKMEVAAGRIQG